MATIHRVRVGLTGLPGLPGVSTFYANAGPDMLVPLRDFYDFQKASFPAGLTIQVENVGDIIDDATGTLVGTWSTTPVAAVQGTSPAIYAAPSGACINWLTNVVSGGRRLRGRTFLVPLGAAEYQTDGTLTPAFMAALTQAAATFQVATVATFLVWGRPRLASPATATRPAVAARAGTSALVTASAFKDKVAVLRSRRD